MNTVIFKWNPAISSYRIGRFIYDMEESSSGEEPDYDWSVWDYEKIVPGDRFFWLKVGYGSVGIVGCGKIVSEPFEAEDWSGKGRRTFYVNFLPDVMINPAAMPILTLSELEREIPSFDWRKGHSGMILPPEAAEKLEALWSAFLTENAELFAKALSREDFDLVHIRSCTESTESAK
ncbi:MAG: hypothetical protein ACI4QA_00810 [Candidatus Spyradosoma sp.]